MLRFDVQADLSAGILEKPCRKAEHILAEQIRKDTVPFVPALTGSLSIRTYVDGGTVVYPGPQSRYLYHGKLMVDPETGSSYAPKGAAKALTDKDLVFNRSLHPLAQDHWFEASKAQNLGKWIEVAGKALKDELGK